MTDPDIFTYINELSAAEERLYATAGDGSGLSTEAGERLEAITVELDRCYDLLHQRQARPRPVSIRRKPSSARSRSWSATSSNAA
jgi:hypothetical protein